MRFRRPAVLFFTEWSYYSTKRVVALCDRRFVLAGATMRKFYVFNSSVPFRFDNEFNMTQAEVRKRRLIVLVNVNH